MWSNHSIFRAFFRPKIKTHRFQHQFTVLYTELPKQHFTEVETICRCTCYISSGLHLIQKLYTKKLFAWFQHSSTKTRPPYHLINNSIHFIAIVKPQSLSYRSLQMQMIGRSRMDSFFFFFFAVSAPASPPCPSFLLSVANRMFMAACQTGEDR